MVAFCAMMVADCSWHEGIPVQINALANCIQMLVMRIYGGGFDRKEELLWPAFRPPEQAYALGEPIQ